ncbi:tRNA pseudouridine(13) synthase TruD [Acanthopleuribacter pedis]|uniref:tRNA pseudouridine(13) synthase TruD n=1 Tax=Acanthopleuribacter pedis TaxID=442870 RepID=A0A8J7U5B0_9BACT|nr:tRNA pseudouridine(13) synthase TruD [Acanthopleuribacter pedis]MBO1319131.1 tRNA pseudouridine(13) synthase TruD [Acanthopleuribacter pedis]
MLHFHQTESTFFVDETLLHPPEGSGPFVFAYFRKRGLSTQRLKQKLSEMTGVPLAHIGHAGLKDHLSTSGQWLSWPAEKQRNAPAQRGENYEILRISRGAQSLKPGLVAANHFQLTLISDQPQQDRARLLHTRRFPNFFGPQRFGSAVYQDHLDAFWPRRARSKGKRAMAVSVLQAFLFNRFLQKRLTDFRLDEHELWQKQGAKRHFQATLEEAEPRFEAGEISPSGPMFGYKTTLTAEETAFLEQQGKSSEDFREFGKVALGTRRPLFVTAEDCRVTQSDDHQLQWHFVLPSGAYATVYLAWLLQQARMMLPMRHWPNYSRPVYFSEDPAWNRQATSPGS